ncbi:MAG: DUF2244 domain-containing protein [Steroidobacteraceae bacterium]|jgi:uncharacterized membrane protein
METRIELKPNCSLTLPAARVFFVSICGFSLVVALLATLQGFWPVLPFWGLEMLGLGLALRSSLRRRLWTQTLLITESQVSLVTRSRNGEAKQEFARHWAKVRLRSPRMRQYPSRLMIESRGRSFEVGSFLTEEERCRLAERLYAMVGGMNESPPLEWE